MPPALDACPAHGRVAVRRTIRAGVNQALPDHPGPDADPAGGGGRRGRPDAAPPKPRVPGAPARDARAAEAGVRDRGRRPALHRVGDRGDGVGGREPALAGRPRRRRLGRQLRRAMGEARSARTASSRSSSSSRGASGSTPAGSPRRPPRRTTAAVFVTHSETSTGVVHDVRGDRERRRADGRRSSSSTPSRAWEASSSRPTPGASTSSSRGRRRRSCRPPGLAFASVSKRAWERVEHARLPALLPRLAPTRRLPGQGRHRLHAGREPRRRAPHGARPHPRAAARRTCGSTTAGWRARPARA